MDKQLTKLVREYGREYSLFRTILLNHVMNYEFPQELAPMPPVNSYAVYRGKGLVYGYHSEAVMPIIFKRITEMAHDDIKTVEKRLDEIQELFNWLKPYYTFQRHITNVAELKEFYNQYRRYFFLQSFIRAVPEIDIPILIRERGQTIREEIQKYGEHAELVFESALLFLYPSLGKDWRFLLPEEVWEGKATDPETLQAIKKRKKGYVLYKEHFYAGSEIDEFLSTLGVVVEDPSQDDIQEFRGQVAQAGIIQGVAKIVDSFDSIDKVMEGDILVATMTMPRYLPAMKKALAFVTDEGGVTCHAAILAREMKKPCIIGTRIATQILRDGDLIEVDADKGIVKILKRS